MGGVSIGERGISPELVEAVVEEGGGGTSAVVVITTTYYPGFVETQDDSDSVRGKLALSTISSVLDQGLNMVVVDGGSNGQF